MATHNKKTAKKAAGKTRPKSAARRPAKVAHRAKTQNRAAKKSHAANAKKNLKKTVRVPARKVAKPKKKTNSVRGPSARKAEPEPKPKARVNTSIYTQEEVRGLIAELSANDAATGYLKKNVSKRALDVMTELTTPKTDEALAATLDMKINAVRRILNIMQGYGITNYYVSKNVNGWLSFAWYINVSKLKPFFDYIASIETKKPIVNEDCNDYFMCGDCYERTKLIFTFDAAFEESFRCGSCGDGLVMINKDQVTDLVRKESAAKVESARAAPKA